MSNIEQMKRGGYLFAVLAVAAVLAIAVVAVESTATDVEYPTVEAEFVDEVPAEIAEVLGTYYDEEKSLAAKMTLGAQTLDESLAAEEFYLLANVFVDKKVDTTVAVYVDDGSAQAVKTYKVSLAAGANVVDSRDYVQYTAGDVVGKYVGTVWIVATPVWNSSAAAPVLGGAAEVMVGETSILAEPLVSDNTVFWTEDTEADGVTVSGFLSTSQAVTAEVGSVTFEPGARLIANYPITFANGENKVTIQGSFVVPADSENGLSIKAGSVVIDGELIDETVDGQTTIGGLTITVQAGEVSISGSMTGVTILIDGTSTVTLADLTLIDSEVTVESADATLTVGNVTLENSTIDARATENATLQDGAIVSVKPTARDKQSAILGVVKEDGSELTVRDLQVTVDSLDEIKDGAILEVDGEKFTVFKRVSNGRTYIVAANATAEFEQFTPAEQISGVELYHITANAFPLTVKVGDAEPKTDVILNSVNFTFSDAAFSGGVYTLNENNEITQTGLSKSDIYYPNGYGGALIYTLSITKQDDVAAQATGGDITTGTITLGPVLYINGVEIQPYMFDFRGHMTDAGEHDYDYYRHVEELAVTAEDVPTIQDASATWNWEYSDYIKLIEETHVTVRDDYRGLLDNYYLDPVVPTLKDAADNEYDYSYLAVTVNAKENTGYTGSFTFYVGLKAWDEAITQFEDDIAGLDDEFRDQWFVFTNYYQEPKNTWDGQPWYVVTDMQSEADYLTTYLEESAAIADKTGLGDASAIIEEFRGKVLKVLTDEYYAGADFVLTDAETYAQEYTDYGYGVDYVTDATYKFYTQDIPTDHSMADARTAINDAANVQANIEGYYVMAPFPHAFINVSFNTPNNVDDVLTYPNDRAAPEKVDYEQFLARQGPAIPGYVFVNQSWFTDEQDFNAYLGQPMPAEQPVVDMQQYFTPANEADEDFVLIAYGFYAPGDSDVTPEYYLYRTVLNSYDDESELYYQTVGKFTTVTGDFTQILLAYEETADAETLTADLDAFFKCLYYDSLPSGVITKIMFGNHPLNGEDADYKFIYDANEEKWLNIDGVSISEAYVAYLDKGWPVAPQFQLDVWKNNHAVDFTIITDGYESDPTPGPQPGEGIEVSPGSVEIEVGSEFSINDFDVEVTGVDDPVVTYTMAANNYAIFDESNGTIVGVAVGQTVMTIAVEGTDLSVDVDITVVEEITPVYSQNYTVSIVQFGGEVYMAFLALDEGIIPAGEYFVVVNFIDISPRTGEAFVNETYIRGTIDVDIYTPYFVPIDASAISDIVAYTPVYSAAGVEVRGLTVNA